ncbi:YkgJ family cysteine cluster protein [bacterium]|nr:YkgJ family cysteine cluster protein [bacterium]
MASLEEQLVQLYARLAPRPLASGNLCGSCRTCCTSGGLSRQNVTDLELSLLELRHGAEVASNFARYARRERDASGVYLFEVCPNLAPEGCRVYAERPFSCRVFGHYRASGTRLPDECVYRGEEVAFPPRQYYDVVPGALRLRELSRDFQLRRPPTGAAGVADQGGVGLNLNDPWDRALEQIGQGKPVELPAKKEGEPIFASYVRAMVLGEAGQHEGALEHYRRVLAACPERADLMTFAGFHAFQVARFEEAEQLWLRALQLDQANPLTYSFLGYLYNHREEWQMAADFFGAAAELQPDQPVHQQRREHALSQLLQA